MAEKERRGHTLFDIRYCITLLHLLHALMLLIPMVLPILGLGGHVGISVPAISSFLVPPYSFVYSSLLCFDSPQILPLRPFLPLSTLY
jgi:hypothetical protein